jgi:hypothetical protein
MSITKPLSTPNPMTNLRAVWRMWENLFKSKGTADRTAIAVRPVAA